VALDVVSGVALHEYVGVCIQALGAAVGTAALEVADLLNALAELGLPGFFGYFDLVAVEKIIDRVCAVRAMSARSWLT
jgi:hypothetical protein